MKTHKIDSECGQLNSVYILLNHYYYYYYYYYCVMSVIIVILYCVWYILVLLFGQQLHSLHELGCHSYWKHHNRGQRDNIGVHEIHGLDTRGRDRHQGRFVVELVHGWLLLRLRLHDGVEHVEANEPVTIAHGERRVSVVAVVLPAAFVCVDPAAVVKIIAATLAAVVAALMLLVLMDSVVMILALWDTHAGRLASNFDVNIFRHRAELLLEDIPQGGLGSTKGPWGRGFLRATVFAVQCCGIEENRVGKLALRPQAALSCEVEVGTHPADEALRSGPVEHLGLQEVFRGDNIRGSPAIRVRDLELHPCTKPLVVDVLQRAPRVIDVPARMRPVGVEAVVVQFTAPFT